MTRRALLGRITCCVLSGPRLNYWTSGQARASSGTAGRAETGTRSVGAESDFCGELSFPRYRLLITGFSWCIVEMEAVRFIFLLSCTCFVYQVDGRKGKWCYFKGGQPASLISYSWAASLRWSDTEILPTGSCIYYLIKNEIFTLKSQSRSNPVFRGAVVIKYSVKWSFYFRYFDSFWHQLSAESRELD